MLKLTIALAFLTVCYALPTGKDEVVPIVAYDSNIEENGKFQFSFESGDGTKVDEHGEIKGTGEEAGEAVEGHYSYTDPDGKLVEVHYTADETGYHPVGDVVPVIPEAIARSIKFNEEHPEPEEKH